MQRKATSKGRIDKGKVYGYICAAEDRDREGIQSALRNYPVAARNIFEDRAKGGERPKYGQLVALLRPGDRLVIQSLESLGRDYEEILTQWTLLTEEKKIYMSVLDLPVMNLREGGGREEAFSREKLVRQLLFYIAQREKEAESQEEGSCDAGPKTYGYIRVSARDQCEDRQLIALREFQVKEEDIFLDKMSGKDFEREQYKRLLRRLKPGDTLVIKEIDRLGRNYEEILEQWRVITKEKKVNIVVLDMPLLSTKKTAKGLTGTFVEDLVLQILSYVAQIERENIRKRQKEGIEAAKKRGGRFGRPRKPMPPSFVQVQREWMAHSISSREAARRLGVSQNTFLRWTKEEFGENFLKKK